MSTLPEGYAFADQVSIEPDEVVALRQAVGWEGGDTEDRWRQNITSCLAAVGIRDTVGQLVGIGFLVGNLRHAVLCDFNVHPDHQGKGLGRAILDERMRIANELRVPYMYTSLAESNPLRTRYQELGFNDTGTTLFRINI